MISVLALVRYDEYSLKFKSARLCRSRVSFQFPVSTLHCEPEMFP
jgi:hypothetical protein